MKHTVRRASPDSLSRLLEIERESFSCPWSEESFRGALETDTVSVFASEDDAGEITGFAVLLIVADEGELLNIASSPSRRRTGIGQALLGRCLEECAARGVTVLYLEVRESNLPARSLYRKNGFREIGVRRDYYIKPRENAILMRRDFAPEAEDSE